jgi:hypothetical protein
MMTSKVAPKQKQRNTSSSRSPLAASIHAPSAKYACVCVIWPFGERRGRSLLLLYIFDCNDDSLDNQHCKLCCSGS